MAPGPYFLVCFSIAQSSTRPDDIGACPSSDKPLSNRLKCYHLYIRELVMYSSVLMFPWQIGRWWGSLAKGSAVRSTAMRPWRRRAAGVAAAPRQQQSSASPKKPSWRSASGVRSRTSPIIQQDRKGRQRPLTRYASARQSAISFTYRQDLAKVARLPLQGPLERRDEELDRVHERRADLVADRRFWRWRLGHRPT